MSHSLAALPCLLALTVGNAWLAPALAQAPAPGTTEEALQRCAAEGQADQRLACYDKLFRTPGQDPLTAARGTPAAQIAGTNGADTTAVSSGPAPAHSALSTFWELDRSDKRKALVVRTFQPNYLLPLHLTSRINRQPVSPTRGVAALKPHYKAVEAKMQISLRVKVAEDVLLPNADVWASYTQRTMWQVWNQADSAPFRSADYQPDLKYVVPVPAAWRQLPAGWSWRMAEAGFAHQSNGQSAPLSRSWNRLYLGAAFERGDVVLQARVNRRPREGSQDDNPDLTRYIGNTELTASWLPGSATANLTWRLHPQHLKNGSMQLDWTYPIDRSEPQGLRWYLQLFTGYGESLLDYNHRQNSLGLGLTLFQL